MATDVIDTANLANEERRRLEVELGTELIPGTEIMADIGRMHFIRGERSGQVLVPQPENDSADPLNWSPRWKFATIMMASLYTFVVPFSQLSIAPIFPILEAEFDVGLSQVANFTGVAILVLGFSNFLWVPLAENFGRRFVFIASALISLGANIWHAVAPSYSSYLGSCGLDGLGSGPGETLMPMIVADVLFLHERGRYITLYFMLYFSSLILSPVVIGAMAQNVGWRNFFWLNVAMRGALIIAAIFLFPETRWPRGSFNVGTASASAQSQKVEVGQETTEGAINPVPTHTSYQHANEYLGKGRPTKSQFRPIQGLVAGTTLVVSLIRDFWVPLKLLLFPIVWFGGQSFNFAANQFLYINLSQSQMLEPPPYQFSSLDVGFTNFAVFIGCVIGLLTAGPVSDWISARATKRNHGIREPEMRLPALVPYLILMIIGNVLISVGADRGWPWYPIVIVGFTFIGIQVSAIPGISCTYMVDCYKPVTGQTFITATIMKNLYGYGTSQFLNDWIARSGFVPSYMLNMALLLLFNGILGLFLYFFGKRVRGWTRNDSVHRMHSHL